MTVGEFSGTGAHHSFDPAAERPLLLPIWIALPPLFAILVVAAFVSLYPTLRRNRCSPLRS